MYLSMVNTVFLKDGGEQQPVRRVVIAVCPSVSRPAGTDCGYLASHGRKRSVKRGVAPFFGDALRAGGQKRATWEP